MDHFHLMISLRLFCVVSASTLVSMNSSRDEKLSFELFAFSISASLRDVWDCFPPYEKYSTHRFRYKGTHAGTIAFGNQIQSGCFYFQMKIDHTCAPRLKLQLTDVIEKIIEQQFTVSAFEIAYPCLFQDWIELSLIFEHVLSCFQWHILTWSFESIFSRSDDRFDWSDDRFHQSRTSWKSAE